MDDTTTQQQPQQQQQQQQPHLFLFQRQQQQDQEQEQEENQQHYQQPKPQQQQQQQQQQYQQLQQHRRRDSKRRQSLLTIPRDPQASSRSNSPTQSLPPIFSSSFSSPPFLSSSPPPSSPPLPYPTKPPASQSLDSAADTFSPSSTSTSSSFHQRATGYRHSFHRRHNSAKRGQRATGNYPSYYNYRCEDSCSTDTLDDQQREEEPETLKLPSPVLLPTPTPTPTTARARSPTSALFPGSRTPSPRPAPLAASAGSAKTGAMYYDRHSARNATNSSARSSFNLPSVAGVAGDNNNVGGGRRGDSCHGGDNDDDDFLTPASAVAAAAALQRQRKPSAVSRNRSRSAEPSSRDGGVRSSSSSSSPCCGRRCGRCRCCCYSPHQSGCRGDRRYSSSSSTASRDDGCYSGCCDFDDDSGGGGGRDDDDVKCRGAGFCGSVCTKTFLITINLTFFVLGWTMMAGGVWVHIYRDSNHLGVLLRDNPTSPLLVSDRIAVFLIVSGAAVSMIGFLGCCGACTESVCFLGFYTVLLVVFIVSQIILVVLISNFQDKLEKNLARSMLYQVKNEYNVSDDHKLTISWDRIQSTMQCCGAIGPLDYHQSAWFNGTTDSAGVFVPTSCCKNLRPLSAPVGPGPGPDATPADAGNPGDNFGGFEEELEGQRSRRRGGGLHGSLSGARLNSELHLHGYGPRPQHGKWRRSPLEEGEGRERTAGRKKSLKPRSALTSSLSSSSSSSSSLIPKDYLCQLEAMRLQFPNSQQEFVHVHTQGCHSAVIDLAKVHAPALTCIIFLDVLQVINLFYACVLIGIVRKKHSDYSWCEEEERI